jgi:predicted nucleotide-binding protein (sugar kinase/HSP70/actin superfamily)
MGAFWLSFFRELGCETVVSPVLTQGAFDEVPKKYRGDICLPIESAFIHAEVLQGTVDFIFVPRVNRLHEDIYVCPACAGMADLLRNILQLPNILSFNLTPFTVLDRSDRSTLKKAGFRGAPVKKAFEEACGAYHSFVERSRENPFLDEIIEKNNSIPRRLEKYENPDGHRILLLGMPYVLADPFISKGIPEILLQRRCQLVTPFMVAPEKINQEYRFEGYYVYWTLGGMSIASLIQKEKEGGIDGVIYCSSFACGVDSAITPIVQSACRRVYDLPYLFLVLDQHVETAHLEVRIEAFLDSLTALPQSRLEERS